MALNTQSFTALVSNMAAAVQGAASQLVDFSIGAVLRAVTEANSAIVLWLQGFALQIAALARFATSNGPDADSWGADFSFTRLPAVSASGSVTFARFTNTMQGVIPVGFIVQTGDGTQQYTVLADASQAAYSASLNAYVIAAGVSSCAATVQAVTPGTGANASPGFINTLGGSLVAVDTVTNPIAFSNGVDLESDTAFKIRFISYIASLAKATLAAIKNAIASVQQGLTYQVTENTSYAGTYTPGYFYAVIDDGTGAPPASLIATVANAIDAVRPIGSSFGVFPPTVVTANIALSITTAAGFAHSSVVALVTAAIQTYVNTLPIGQPLAYSRLAQIAYDAFPGVTNVTGVTLNSGTADLTVTPQQVIKCGTLAIA